jgi:hypothetical protein
MRHLFQFLSALGFALVFTAFANAEAIAPSEAAQYVGSSSTVEGVVSRKLVYRGGCNFGCVIWIAVPSFMMM